MSVLLRSRRFRRFLVCQGCQKFFRDICIFFFISEMSGLVDHFSPPRSHPSEIGFGKFGTSASPFLTAGDSGRSLNDSLNWSRAFWSQSAGAMAGVGGGRWGSKEEEEEEEFVYDSDWDIFYQLVSSVNLWIYESNRVGPLSRFIVSLWQ